MTAAAVSIGVIWGVADMGRLVGAGEPNFMLGVVVWFAIVGAAVILQLRTRSEFSPNSFLVLTLFAMVLGTVVGVIANIAVQPEPETFHQSDVHISF